MRRRRAADKRVVARIVVDLRWSRWQGFSVEGCWKNGRSSGVDGRTTDGHVMMFYRRDPFRARGAISSDWRSVYVGGAIVKLSLIGITNNHSGGKNEKRGCCRYTVAIIQVNISEG